ncbi:MAG: hypothetical protein M1445_12985 [Bacteroidetes bacterium]|nr:hypothetical protein [Bacteroidota bacterium]MCL6101562.1 hypothetical protein [Bacteroidota bacterium]
MKSTLHDVYFYRDDYPELAELYEESFDVGLQLKMINYHFVFLKTSGGNIFIYREGSQEPIPRLRQEFHSRIEHVINPTIDALCFVLANYILDSRIEEINLPIPNPATAEEIIPECVLELIQQTSGYLLYREQGVKFYQLATGCNEAEAKEWVAGARSKKKVILDNVRNLNIDGCPSTYIEKLFPPNGGLPYLIRKPEQEAHKLLEFLQSKSLKS